MRAELKSIMSPDVDLENFVPDESEGFSVFVQAFIGPMESSGADSFGITVCDPTWIERQLVGKKYAWGYRTLVLEKYDFGVLKSAIERLCGQVSGQDWGEIAGKLNSYAAWERCLST